MQPWQYTSAEWERIPAAIQGRIARHSPLSLGSNPSHTNYHAMQVYNAALVGNEFYVDPEVLESLPPQLTQSMALHIVNHHERALPAMLEWAVDYLTPAAFAEFTDYFVICRISGKAIAKYREGLKLLVQPATTS